MSQEDFYVIRNKKNGFYFHYDPYARYYFTCENLKGAVTFTQDGIVSFMNDLGLDPNEWNSERVPKNAQNLKADTLEEPKFFDQTH